MERMLGLRLSISLSLVLYKNIATSNIKFDGFIMKSLVGLGSSSDRGNLVVQGCAKLR